MQLPDFIRTIESEFDDVKPGSLSGDTEFRKLESWSSMMALIIIAKIDSDYNVTITADELARCNTLHDLFGLVSAKIN